MSLDRGVPGPNRGGAEPGRARTPEQQRDDDDRLLDLCGGTAGPDHPDGPLATPVDWTGADRPPAAEVTAWLAAWRNELSDGIGPARLDLDAVPSAVAVSSARRTRWRRRLLSAGAAVVIAGSGGGVAVAAADSQPGGPLWPITRLVYPEQAQARLAQQEAEELLDGARSALADGRYEEARRLLGEADPLVDRVMDPGERRRLADDLAQIRGLVGLFQVSQSPPAEDPRDDPPTDDRAGPEVPPPPSPIVLPAPPDGDPGLGATPAPEAHPAPRTPVVAPTEPSPLSPPSLPALPSPPSLPPLPP